MGVCRSQRTADGVRHDAFANDEQSTTDKENMRQLVIDVSRAGDGTAEKVANTEVAKQAIQQGMSSVERLAGTAVKGFRVWRANEGTSVIKFSVDKDKEAAVRQTTADWLEPALPGARLVGPKWYPVKVDWIEVGLAMDAESGKVSRSAMERFGTENGVEVCTMRWLGRPRPSGQHASVVVKVATKEEAEKLLKSDSVTFGGGGIMGIAVRGATHAGAVLPVQTVRTQSTRLHAAGDVRHVRAGGPLTMRDDQPALHQLSRPAPGVAPTMPGIQERDG
jgi:hypothetical protein